MIEFETESRIHQEMDTRCGQLPGERNAERLESAGRPDVSVSNTKTFIFYLDIQMCKWFRFKQNVGGSMTLLQTLLREELDRTS